MRSRAQTARSVICISGVSIFIAAFAIWLEFSSHLRMTSLSEIKRLHPASDTVVVDRRGNVLEIVRTNFKQRLITWTPLADIAPDFLTSLIQSEDATFFEHRGVRWGSLARSFYSAATGTRRGGSTITMQVAKLLTPRTAPQRGVRFKLHQVVSALSLEQSLTKEEILEAYVNLLPFRGETVGVFSAAWTSFRKSPSRLNGDESALLVALLPSPNSDWQKVIDRACRIQRRLSALTTEVNLCDRDKLLHLAQQSHSEILNPGEAPELARLMIDENVRRPRRTNATYIHSTIDQPLQRATLSIVNERLTALQTRNVHDAAVIVVENETGNVLAYVGNRGSSSRARFIDGVQMRRQAGSTLKPFLYARAIAERYLTSSSILKDEPLDLVLGNASYRPRNYDNGYHGPVPVRVALASSLNIPAVRTIELIGVDALVEQLHNVGFTDIGSAARFGPSLALGSASVSLSELTNGYRTFARSGQWSKLRYFDEAVVPNSSLSHSNESSLTGLDHNAAFIISSILSDRSARALTFGLGSNLDTPQWTAVKTGTSRDMTDNWCIGYSKTFTVGVWVGNFDGKPMWNVSGVDGAAPIWQAVMQRLSVFEKKVASSIHIPLPKPATVISLDHDETEYYIQGTESSVTTQKERRTRARIEYPPDGLVIAYDSDITSAKASSQMIRLTSSAAPENQREFSFLVDGRPIQSTAHYQNGKTVEVSLWAVEAGTHRIDLVRGNETVDSHTVYVRGTQPQSQP